MESLNPLILMWGRTHLVPTQLRFWSIKYVLFFSARLGTWSHAKNKNKNKKIHGSCSRTHVASYLRLQPGTSSMLYFAHCVSLNLKLLIVNIYRSKICVIKTRWCPSGLLNRNFYLITWNLCYRKAIKVGNQDHHTDTGTTAYPRTY